MNTPPVAPDVPQAKAPALPAREAAVALVVAHYEDPAWFREFVEALSDEDHGLGGAGLALLRALQDADMPTLHEEVA